MRYKRTTTIKANNITKLHLIIKLVKKIEGENDTISEDYINKRIIITTFTKTPGKVGILAKLLKIMGLEVKIKSELVK